MKLFVTVIGLIMVVEGLPYFAFPEKMKAFLAQIQEMPPESLRWLGFFLMCTGLLLCYLARRTGIFS
ncbi:MAG: DUF2065 domain-containing protein [Thermodesulfobacteria bacterium]|nr:DUF2065 domain-containing protein [Thermodesulfobacteriota bacterium]